MKICREGLRAYLPIGAMGAAICALGVIMAAAVSTPTRANPYFFQQTKQQCGHCHVPGGELKGANGGLNATGQAFDRRFRQCPDCALKEFALHAQPAQPAHSGALCNRFDCNSHAVCRFRIRFAAGGSRELTIRKGENYTVRNVHPNDRWCFIEPNGTCEMKSMPTHPC